MSLDPTQAASAPFRWPREDYSRVPYRLYHDEALYALEMERIFRGPCWSFLALEAELPKPGDFRTTWVGDTPVVVSRDRDGALHAFVNRCAHRGAMIVRESHGNAAEHVCIYHRWCYSQAGELIGIPFRRGLKGEGGMPAEFDPQSVAPRRLHLASVHGMLFGTFSDATEPIERYLGEFGMSMLKRFFERPIRVIGYSRQLIEGNWKFYAENLRDTYHASLLHEFFVTYGVDRATQKGGVKMDARHRHNMNHAYAATDSQEEARAAYAGNKGIELDRMRLRDQKLLRYIPEFADGMNLAAPTFFPNALVIQINNTLGVRQIRPKGVDRHEVFQTLFGYADDTEEMTRHRLMSANLVGPAGLVSMEDGEAIEIAHKATRHDHAGASTVEMGGRGPLRDLAHRVTETPIRGFWSYWSELMGMEAPGGIR
jgi:anthranilate 1,2-dioxygenase large subunit